MMASEFLKAFEGSNARVPVWFMRQAGRFLPEYRRIKERHSLHEMFTTPELVADVTCLPVKRLKVDAAILFADILTLPGTMGMDISFVDGIGPVIRNPIGEAKDVRSLHDMETPEYLGKAISWINGRLPVDIPLLGFAGSPFTVLAYLVDGKATAGFRHTLCMARSRPDVFHALMEKISDNTVAYLKYQKEAGIKAFQLFDTWAGILRPADYGRWVLPYVKRIFHDVTLPSIYYVRNCSHLLALMDETDADFLSVCHTVVLGHNAILGKTRKGIQGNLFNGLLYADDKTLKKEICDVLTGAQHYDKYIFNLSHGIMPDTDVRKAELTIDCVRSFSWRRP